MINNWLIKYIDENYRENSLAYNSDIEEAIKLVLLIKKSNKPVIVLKENAYLASRLIEKVKPFFIDEEIISYLPEESLRAEEIASSFENRSERINALYNILTNRNLKAVITTSYGFVRHLPEKDCLLNGIVKLKVNDEINKETLIEKLKYLGYEKVNRVETPMTYASRGYIVDIFSVNYSDPIRIEFFDDYIDSIRFFDLNTQRTINNAEEVDVIFAKDVFFSDEEKTYLKKKVEPLSGEMEINLEYIFNDVYRQSQYFYYAYFSKAHLKDYFNDSFVYLSNKDKIVEHHRFIIDESTSYIQEMYDEKKLPLKFSVCGDLHRLLIHQDLIEAKPYSEPFSLVNEVDLPYGQLEYLLPIVYNNQHKYKILVLSNEEVENVVNSLIKLKLPYNLFDGELLEGLNIGIDFLDCGFESDSLDLIVYTGKDLFKQKRHIGRYVNKYQESINLNSYEELKPGDFVVHDQYGIGQYEAIETRCVNGINMDYLKIIYKGNDELLVPLSQFKLVRKYVSKEGAVPKLHKLGSKEWIETKKRVEENVNNIAEKLVELYAQREGDIGFAFSKDDIMHQEFADEFAYELTSDQKQAIHDVKLDMESKKPMDRLLCGDVGFGKTEVAIRAAFKAVYDHKQVVYLCPTTVLSLQHFNTFKERFSNYPIRVELLNRYVLPNKQKEIIAKLKTGEVDILIGTHRVLSNDVKLNDLGLLIIDEEQRFGVEHKEKIKEIKQSVDVLSLSATPIPRTLQMSLIGLRGLSTLNTPPLNRYPVQTYIVHKNENLIKEVIERELQRNGQVFYLYNNVEKIYSVARKIAKDVPYASTAVVHGQMSSNEIEDVMVRFYNGEVNVLICTTIIETGLDIPNANTIIVENAQNFGLAQLYQIKGRVGRSDKIAYAYLLVPEKKQLTEDSAKRLEAIKEFTSLGSGYKIAMRDLTIRGAGDLLGPKQSGFIDNVGLDLYLLMLNNAIKKQKGEEVIEETVTPSININIESYLPEGFNDNDYEKLSLYHELDEINDSESLLNFYLKIKDEYGKLPKEVEALFEKKRLAIMVNLGYIDNIYNRNGKFTICLTKEYSDNIDGLKLFEYCSKLSKDIVINYKHSKLEFTVDNQGMSIELILKLIDNLDKLEKDENR